MLLLPGRKEKTPNESEARENGAKKSEEEIQSRRQQQQWMDAWHAMKRSVDHRHHQQSISAHVAVDFSRTL
jgi:hypothetical protein